MNVVSLSGGKDSTAMLLRMIELDYKIDEILFFDGGWEFPQMYAHIEKLEKYISRPITRIYPSRTFDELLGRYGWPKSFARWCTARKRDELQKKKWRGCHHIGIAADEHRRIKNNRLNMKHPLVEWGWTERDCLDYCSEHGFTWDGLYTHFKRVSCFCCPLQGVGALRTLYDKYPIIWKMLKEKDKLSKQDLLSGYRSVAMLERNFEEMNKQMVLGEILET